MTNRKLGGERKMNQMQFEKNAERIERTRRSTFGEAIRDLGFKEAVTLIKPSKKEEQK